MADGGEGGEGRCVGMWREGDAHVLLLHTSSFFFILLSVLIFNFPYGLDGPYRFLLLMIVCSPPICSCIYLCLIVFLQD